MLAHIRQSQRTEHLDCTAMPTQIALLRGINLGSHNRMPMNTTVKLLELASEREQSG